VGWKGRQDGGATTFLHPPVSRYFAPFQMKQLTNRNSLSKYRALLDENNLNEYNKSLAILVNY
jgi:hypothetical protein